MAPTLTPERPPPYSIDRDTLERECTLDPTRGSGPGGQRRNKVETGIRLSHPPSGEVVVATGFASQLMNREAAFERLIQRLVVRNHVPKPRRATKPTRGSKKRRLEGKRLAGEKKKNRGGGGGGWNE